LPCQPSNCALATAAAIGGQTELPHIRTWAVLLMRLALDLWSDQVVFGEALGPIEFRRGQHPQADLGEDYVLAMHGHEAKPVRARDSVKELVEPGVLVGPEILDQEGPNLGEMRSFGADRRDRLGDRLAIIVGAV
jgi:hypothetical protein